MFDLHDLRADDCDHPADRDISPEELDAFYKDMDATPLDLPTEAELTEMAKAHGLDQLPF